MDTTVTLAAARTPQRLARTTHRLMRHNGPCAKGSGRPLLKVLPTRSVLWRDEAVTPYECDGLTAYRRRPLAVALPESHEQVGAVLAACHALQVPVVAWREHRVVGRGHARQHGRRDLSLARLTRIVRIDPWNRTAVVRVRRAQPGHQRSVQPSTACTTPPTPAARSPAALAAMCRKTPAASIA